MINLASLYTLGRCIAALAKQSQVYKSKQIDPSCKHIHIPFRDSKLTRLLQDSIGGNSQTYLVATVNPSLACSDESISTLRFADRAHQVRDQPTQTIINVIKLSKLH